MGHAVLHEYGILVVGQAGSLETAAAVNAHIDDDRAFPHVPHHVLGDDHRGPSEVGTHRTDDHVGLLEGLAKHLRVQGARPQASADLPPEPAQAIRVRIEDPNRRSESDGGPGCELPDRSGPDDDHLRRGHPGHAPHHGTVPEFGMGKVFGSD